jgi:hypothetical protein
MFLSLLAKAEVIDSATQRTFFTSKTPCKLAIPKADFVISKEQLNADGTTVFLHAH